MKLTQVESDEGGGFTFLFFKMIKDFNIFSLSDGRLADVKTVDHMDSGVEQLSNLQGKYRTPSV